MKSVLILMTLVFGYGASTTTSSTNSSATETDKGRIFSEIQSLKTMVNNLKSQLDIYKRKERQSSRDIAHLKEGPNYCGCTDSGYINGLDATMDYSIPNNKIITGFFSWHDDWFQDREWKVKYCSIC